jgi:catechol 2,3-dioxygenase-like lactoylglutathione lyase family enzyme
MHEELTRLVDQYDRGTLTRRQLLGGLVALGLGGGAGNPRTGPGSNPGHSPPLFKTRTINHVTLYSADVARSKAFYQTLTGLPIRAEDKDFCEFRLDGGFLGIYATEPGHPAGFDHFCFGIEQYDPKTALAALEASVPGGKPTLEPGDQVYVNDPDGVRVQFADVTYKR